MAKISAFIDRTKKDILLNDTDFIATDDLTI